MVEKIRVLRLAITMFAWPISSSDIVQCFGENGIRDGIEKIPFYISFYCQVFTEEVQHHASI